MISKTKINKRLNRKTNKELVETINLAKKNNQLKLAKKLSAPSSQQISINVGDLDNLNEEKLIICGKVLGNGSVIKKKKIYALNFSSQANEKLKEIGCEIGSIKKELEKNPKLNEVKVL